MSFWRVAPAGSWPALTKGWLPPPLTILLLPEFWMTVLVWELVRPVVPLRPAMEGMLSRLLLRKPLRLLLFRGVPPLTGKMLLFGFEKGTLATVLAMNPVTTLTDGFDPPRMSCMKKDKCGATPGFATVVAGPTTGVATGSGAFGVGMAGPTTGIGALGDGMTGLTTGVATVAVLGNSGCGETTSGTAGVIGATIGDATSAGGVTSSTGAAVSGIGASASSSLSSTVVAGIWPLGNGVVGFIGFGATTVVGRGLAASSRILAELAYPSVMMARNNM